MLLQVFPIRREQLEVVGAVVLFVAVAMMHNFTGVQRSADDLLHHQEVFADVPVCIGARVVWALDKFVSVFDDERLAMKVSAASHRTKSRAICAALSANTNSDSAERALPVDVDATSIGSDDCQWPRCSAAGVGAEMALPIHLAPRAVERRLASVAGDVRQQRGRASVPNGFELGFGRFADLHQMTHRVVTRLVAKDARQVEAGRREIHFVAAGGAMTNHARIISNRLATNASGLPLD